MKINDNTLISISNLKKYSNLNNVSCFLFNDYSYGLKGVNFPHSKNRLGGLFDHQKISGLTEVFGLPT